MKKEEYSGRNQQQQYRNRCRHRNRGNRIMNNLWPFRMSSADNNIGDNNGTGGQHLVRAGQELHAAAKSVGPSNYACPNLMKDAGEFK